jgi:hypothetical protein
VVGDRATTTGPAQALFFMNGPLVFQQADALAERLLAQEGGDSRRVEVAYRIALARGPTDLERDRAVAFLGEFAARVEGTDATRETWSAFCQALVAGAEFRCVD